MGRSPASCPLKFFHASSKCLWGCDGDFIAARRPHSPRMTYERRRPRMTYESRRPRMTYESRRPRMTYKSRRPRMTYKSRRHHHHIRIPR
eukprot:gene29900-17973_t